MAMDLVGDNASNGTYAGTDNRASGTTNLSPHNRSANRAAGDELCLGVVMMVVGVRLGDRVFV